MEKQISKLLREHPKVTAKIQEAFITKLVASIDKDKMPEDFQEFVKSQTMEESRLAEIVKAAPHSLFNVFDEEGIYISIIYQDEVGFVWDMGHPYENPSIPFNTRLQAEKKAIFRAFEILEDKLNPTKDEEKEEKS